MWYKSKLDRIENKYARKGLRVNQGITGRMKTKNILRWLRRVGKIINDEIIGKTEEIIVEENRRGGGSPKICERGRLLGKI